MQPGVTPGAVYEFHAARCNGGTSPGVNDPLTTTAFDTSLNGHHGTLQGFAGTEASGYAGIGTIADPRRLVFDPTSPGDYVARDSAAGLALAALSIELWARLPATQTQWGDIIIYKGTTGNDNYGWRILHYSTALGMYALQWGTGAAQPLDTPVTLPDLETAHAVWTHDGSTVRRYVSGNESGAAKTGQSSPAYTGSSVFRLMKSSYSNLVFASGSILVVRVYPFALTPAQVAQNYAAGPLWTGPLGVPVLGASPFILGGAS